jgi:hypothetical protein
MNIGIDPGGLLFIILAAMFIYGLTGPHGSGKVVESHEEKVGRTVLKLFGLLNRKDD